MLKFQQCFPDYSWVEKRSIPQFSGLEYRMFKDTAGAIFACTTVFQRFHNWRAPWKNRIYWYIS